MSRVSWRQFEGLKRFCELVDSPYHGLNLCCGTAAEGLDDPRTELCPIVKYALESVAPKINENLWATG